MIDLFSDTAYLGYQHVNQMIFRYISRNHPGSRFFHRFYMGLPSLRHFKSLCHSHKSFEDNVSYPGVVKVFNFPSIFGALDMINYFVLEKKLDRGRNNVALTFVPSKALERSFKNYRALIYYCVHDSIMQRYHARNVDYEKKMISDLCRVVFFDNIDVMVSRTGMSKRLVSDLSLLSDEELMYRFQRGERYFYVPPPIPEEFRDVDHRDMEFDFVYYGSRSNVIDVDCLNKLHCNGFRVLIVSSDDFSDVSYTCKFQSTSDMKRLARYISSARNIILPYTSSEFVKTISPAKIYQSLSTGKPTYTNNLDLLSCYQKEGLRHIDDKSDKELDVVSRKYFDKYYSSELMRKINLIVSEVG